MHQPLERRATMRKVILSLAAAAATLAVAAPASAQAWGNMTPSRGYAAPGYGYANYNRANVRALQVRVDSIQRQISHLARYRMISPNEYRNLLRDSREVERAIHHNARDGRNWSYRW
jgi:hypothetical protein